MGEYAGVPSEAAHGTAWYAVVHPDDLPQVLVRWNHSISTGEPYEVEFRLRRHDGEYRWHVGRAQAQKDDAGRVVRWFGTNTDIEDQRRET